MRPRHLTLSRNICIVTPAPPGSRRGNRVTAERWRDRLTELGHAVTVAESYEGQDCALLIALHARHSHSSIKRFIREHPEKPFLVALTGTDLYGDIHTDPAARESIELADRLIVLQPSGIDALPIELRPAARSIIQSAVPPAEREQPRRDCFEVAWVGHFRAVKDPFRIAEAVALLPQSSQIRVTAAGGILDADMEPRLRDESERNPRYEWVGELSSADALGLIDRARLLVLTSHSEGGANVICEALACGTPILSSRIQGSIGLLSWDYPGYFEVGDTAGLAALLERAESDPEYYALLQEACHRRDLYVEPDREREAWRWLLAELHLLL